jgi:hypothetical protein
LYKIIFYDISAPFTVYDDDFHVNPLHTITETALTADQIYEKLKDNTTRSKELPAYKKLLTFKKITKGSKEKYIFQEMSDF